MKWRQSQLPLVERLPWLDTALSIPQALRSGDLQGFPAPGQPAGSWLQAAWEEVRAPSAGQRENGRQETRGQGGMTGSPRQRGTSVVALLSLVFYRCGN